MIEALAEVVESAETVEGADRTMEELSPSRVSDLERELPKTYDAEHSGNEHLKNDSEQLGPSVQTDGSTPISTEDLLPHQETTILNQISQEFEQLDPAKIDGTVNDTTKSTNNPEELSLETSDTEVIEYNKEELSAPEEANFTVDDNGKPYMKDCNLVPNNEYTLNGYHYKTDNQGRIIEGSGTIKIPEFKTERPALPELEDRRDTDDRGHVVARELGGADTKGNLVPMDSELNRNGDYRNFEREVKGATENGKEVEVTVEIEYEGDSKRPSSFTVTVEVDGDISEKTFINK